MCKNQMLMKSKMEAMTNTQENWILYTLTTGGTEDNLTLLISMHSGINNFCHEVETAWLEILEDKFKYIRQSQKDLGPPRGCSPNSKHDPRYSRGTISSTVRRGIL